MDDITKRKQGKEEPVSEFITEIQNKYRSLPVQVDEEQQCHRIQSNLRSEIAIAIAPYRFDRVDQLEEFARNIERNRDLHTVVSNKVAKFQPKNFTRYKQQFKKAFCLDLEESGHETEMESENETEQEGENDSAEEAEICAIAMEAARQGFRQARRDNTSRQPFNSNR